MFNNPNLFGAAVLLLLLVACVPDAASYSKYGRTCKDIGCLSDEVCVMMEDPCTGYMQDRCGRYPTCKKSHAGEVSCASTVCLENDYCKVENGVPKCVSKITSNGGFESAGVAVVNGQRVSSNDDSNKHTNNHNTNTNPYANANAPPAPPGGFPDTMSGGGTAYHHEVNSGTGNLGYPAYPGAAGGNTGGKNNGYPPYPSTTNNNQGNHRGTDNLGYPPYPTQNRMPMPGQTYPGQMGYPGYPGYQGYPAYPAGGQQQSGGYPSYPNSGGQRYPTGQYPGYQNYPNQNHRGYNVYGSNPYRKSSAASPSVLQRSANSIFVHFVCLLSSLFSVTLLLRRS